jgi:hypothetical protein
MDGMDELVEFLRARFAEDEAVARAASVGGRWRYEGTDGIGAWTLYDEEWRIGTLKTYRHDDYDYARVPNFRDPRDIDADANGAHIARHDPARVLAECEAKRQVVEDMSFYWREYPEGLAARELADRTLTRLAVPYADHPDFREEWRA